MADARPQRRLRSASLAVLLAAGAASAAAYADDVDDSDGERPTPEIIFIEPATGTTVSENPFEVRGHNAGMPVSRGLVLRAPTFVGMLRFDDEARFRVPIYLWADAQGRTLQLEMRLPDGTGTGPVVARTELDLPATIALDELETRLAELDQALHAEHPADGVEAVLTLATDLRNAGHPILASVTLARAERLPSQTRDALEPTQRARMLAARLELDVILGHSDASAGSVEALRALAVPAQDASAGDDALPIGTLLSLSEQIYGSAALALVQGFERARAEAIHELANDLHQRARRLPRRLPRGY